jgi:hypothetical protein
MRIEVYVVRTELKTLKQRAEIQKVKENLITEYGGLTEIQGTKGYWLDSEGKLYTDKTDIWVILTKDTNDNLAIIEDYAKKVKVITRQSAQLFTINNTSYMV